MQNITLTSEQLAEVKKESYARGFKCSAIIFGSLAILVFVVMANIVIYVGQ